ALPLMSIQENTYWTSFARLTVLDLMTIDIYNADSFDLYVEWANLAHANNKAVSIEETWAPHYLPSPLPGTAFNQFGYLITSLNSITVVGPCSADFASMDANWLQAMAMFASFYNMEAVTAFTTEDFFALGSGGHDRPGDSAYDAAALQAIQ